MLQVITPKQVTEVEIFLFLDESSPESETIVKKDEEEEEVEFSEMEANIRDNITDNEPLTNETLEQILPAWWNEEPFKLV